MLKYLLIVLFIVLQITSAVTQDYNNDLKKDSSNLFNFVLSTPYEKNLDYYGFHFSKKKISKKVVTVKKHDQLVYIETFDTESMQQVSAEKYNDFPKKSYIEKVCWVNDKLYCFYSKYNKKDKISNVYCREVNFEKGVFNDSGKEIIKMEGEISSPGWQFHFSNDNSKVLIQTKKWTKGSDYKVKSPTMMYFFDSGMKPIMQKKIIFPYVNRKMEFFDFEIDSVCNTYIIIKAMFSDGAITYDTDANTKKIYELIKIDHNSSSIKKSQINLGNKFINDIWIRRNERNEIICAGFYYKSRHRINSDGIFITKINEEGFLGDPKFYEIPLEILNQYERTATKNKNKDLENRGIAEFRSMGLNKLLVQDDGSLILIGEEHYTSSTSDGSSSIITYYYNDILVTKIDTEGELVWMRKLPKKQEGGSKPGGLSFRHFVIQKNHYFIYFDNIKNIDLSLDKAPVRHVDYKGGYLMVYKISDDKGVVEKKSIFNSLDIEDQKLKSHCTECIVELSDNEFLLEYQLGKKQKIKVKLTIK